MSYSFCFGRNIPKHVLISVFKFNTFNLYFLFALLFYASVLMNAVKNE